MQVHWCSGLRIYSCRFLSILKYPYNSLRHRILHSVRLPSISMSFSVLLDLYASFRAKTHLPRTQLSMCFLEKGHVTYFFCMCPVACLSSNVALLIWTSCRTLVATLSPRPTPFRQTLNFLHNPGVTPLIHPKIRPIRRILISLEQNIFMIYDQRDWINRETIAIPVNRNPIVTPLHVVVGVLVCRKCKWSQFELRLATDTTTGYIRFPPPNARKGKMGQKFGKQQMETFIHYFRNGNVSNREGVSERARETEGDGRKCSCSPCHLWWPWDQSHSPRFEQCYATNNQPHFRWPPPTLVTLLWTVEQFP